MKTLYVSDLDGTLLNKNAELSQYTIETINELIKKGLYFTVATARSAGTADSILKELCLTLPVILMNGVLVYDISSKRYLNVEYLPADVTASICQILKDCQLTGFMYQVKDHTLTTYYERFVNTAQKDFYEERVNKYRKVFIQVDSFSQVNPAHIIYFALLDTRERLEPAYQSLKSHKDIALAFYKDIYTEDLWYLEIFSVHATKYNAVQYLRNQYDFDTIIGFGDNLNDLPLFKACDVTCAVNNAKQELKAAATHIIGNNTEDGVAGWIRRNFYDK